MLIPIWRDNTYKYERISSQFGLHLGGDLSWISLETKGRRGPFQNFKVLLPGVCDRSRGRKYPEAFENAVWFLSIILMRKWSRKERRKCQLIRYIHIFFFFSGLHLQHTEDLGLGVQLELQLPAYTTARATQVLSCICNLCCSLQECWILNPLSKARDQTLILTDTTQVLHHWATMGTLVNFLSKVYLVFFCLCHPLNNVDVAIADTSISHPLSFSVTSDLTYSHAGVLVTSHFRCLTSLPEVKGSWNHPQIIFKVLWKCLRSDGLRKVLN